MPLVFNIAKQAKDGKFFRELARELQDLPNSDWTEWEWNWLGHEARRPESYSFSETEREKLAQLYSYSRLCTEHDGVTVAEMIRVCHRYCADYGEDDFEFLSTLHDSKAVSVRIRQLRRLTGLYEVAGELIDV